MDSPPSRALQIPLELQKDIIDCCFADYHAYIHYDIAHTVLPLLLVCKAWNAYVLPLLYNRVYLERYSAYLDFSTATRDPERACLVKYLSFNLMKGERSITHLFRSNIIDTILDQCEKADTFDFVIDWDVAESIPVMTSLGMFLGQINPR
jgi:hypothetical protein